MAAEGGAIITFIFNGENRDDIPRDITHLIIHENITVIPARLFVEHPNLVEVYCHAGVLKIEWEAFFECKSLRRLIIPGVTIIERFAFFYCSNLIYIQCDKLERIEKSAFDSCLSLTSINLPSAKIVELCALSNCLAMTEAIFGKDLESIGYGAFMDCRSLESITIPLRKGLIVDKDTFCVCVNLKRVNLIEGEALRDTTDALLLEDWKNEINEVIDSIDQILPNAAAGSSLFSNAGKAIAIREWIESILRKVTHYKAAHRKLLNEAAATLQRFLPNDMMIDNILPFAELPEHIFDGEDEG